MKMMNCIIAGWLAITLCAAANEDAVFSGKLKEIAEGKAGQQKGWKVYFLFTQSLDYDMKRIYVMGVTPENAKGDKKLIEYFYGREFATREMRQVVNAAYDSQRKEVEPGEIDSLLGTIAEAEAKQIADAPTPEPVEDEYERYISKSRLCQTFLSRGSTCGIMIGFFNNDVPQYVIVLAPGNEYMRGTEQIGIVSFLFAEDGKVKDVEGRIVKRNDKINAEIEKLWEKLDIGVWARETPYKSGRDFAFMPTGMKENMYSIEEFAVVKFKAKLLSSNTVIAERYTTPIEELKKIKSARALTLAEEQKLNDLQTRYNSIILPDLKEMEEKLEYFEKKLEEKREREKDGKGKNGQKGAQ